MKILVLLISGFVQLNVIAAWRIIPDYLPQPCSKSLQNYSECAFENLNKTIPYLLKGVPELSIPKLVPLEIPVLMLNKSLCEYLSVSTVLKNIVVWGLDSIQLESLKFDPESLSGELRLTVPERRVSTDYDLTGRILTFDLHSAGILQSNTTNTCMTFKFSLRKTEKLGVKYYEFEDVKAKASVENAHIKMISGNPAYQMAADIIANFFNENPQRTIEAVKPLCEEAIGLFFKSLAGRILGTVPAEELIPE